MTLNEYIDDQLGRGRYYFSKEQAIKAIGCTPDALTAAATRLIKKQRLFSPWRGFYLILRAEDRVAGAPEPARWIDALMKFLEIDYRISLLRAAAFHGSSHQAIMVFQLVVPKQLRSFEAGRHRIQFIYQKDYAFNEINRPEFLQELKSDTGFAKVAGVELTLLDSARYFHKAGGINGLAQIVHDVADKADRHKLCKAAASYENSAVRRLGYLLDHFGFDKQALSLVQFARAAKSLKPLDPSVRPLIEGMEPDAPRNEKWMLVINEPVEIDL